MLLTEYATNGAGDVVRAVEAAVQSTEVEELVIDFGFEGSHGTVANSGGELVVVSVFLARKDLHCVSVRCHHPKDSKIMAGPGRAS